MALGRLLGVGLPHLATKALELLFQRRQQQIQAVLVQFAEVARVLLEDPVGEVLELLAKALFRLLLQLQLLGGGQSLAAQGGFGILETGGELDEQNLLLLQLLLALQLFILQLVTAICSACWRSSLSSTCWASWATPRRPASQPMPTASTAAGSSRVQSPGSIICGSADAERVRDSG